LTPTTPPVVDVKRLSILPPKRETATKSSWEAFLPYYAGFPEKFASAILTSANLPLRAVVLDPWNGSGTTTYAATKLGLSSLGYDLNPVMVIIAKARLLPPSETDSIVPLGREILDRALRNCISCEPVDPLSIWFAPRVASVLRSIERSIAYLLVGAPNRRRASAVDRMSSLAATYYVALFSVCRELTAPFRSSNPSWLRYRQSGVNKVRISDHALMRMFQDRFEEMTRSIGMCSPSKGNRGNLSKLRVSDTSKILPQRGSADLILTSPPYCTRIDYTAATRAELAAVSPLLNTRPDDLARQMIGSTKVPLRSIAPSEEWGDQCNAFLRRVRGHHSKASSGYYYVTHLDYFDKIFRSITNLERCLSDNGTCIFVVQDSFYKDVHNDLPTIIAEMAASRSLALRRREDFYSLRSMSTLNPRARAYDRKLGAVESVLCFQKWH
jgi:hypothetical protein